MMTLETSSLKISSNIHKSQTTKSIQIPNHHNQTITNQTNNHPLTSKAMMINPWKIRILMTLRISE